MQKDQENENGGQIADGIDQCHALPSPSKKFKRRKIDQKWQSLCEMAYLMVENEAGLHRFIPARYGRR
jgi:hypothetical protein